MAQPIHCDQPGEPHLADVLISPLDGSATMAWCNEHYLLVMTSIVDAVHEAEAAATAAEVEARLAGDPPPPAFPTSPESSSADTRPAEPPTSGARRRSKPETGDNATPGLIAPQGPEFDAVGDPAAVATDP